MTHNQDYPFAMQLIKNVPFFSAIVIMSIMLFTATAGAQNSCEFDNFDQDGDDTLDRSELSTALEDMDVYSTWNEEGLMTAENWPTGFQEYYSGYDNKLFGDYTDWDIDDDGEIAEDEFEERIFGLMDGNDNDLIDQGEWDRFDEYLCQ